MNELLEVRVDDGTRNAMRVFEGRGRDEVMLCVPGMGIDATYYEPFARALAERGPTVVTVDLRGRGESDVRVRRGVDFGYREMVEHDYPAYLRTVREAFGDRPVFLVGHSLGGQLGALHLAREPGDVRGLVLVAACTVYHRNWGPWRGTGLWAVAQGYGLVARTLGYFPGRRLGFGDTEARTVMLDWAHNARTGRYRPHGATFDYEAGLREVEVPVLGLAIAGDTWAPEAAVRHLVEKMPAAEATLRVVGPDPRERIDHFRWARHPSVVVDAIATWLDRS